MKKLNYIFLFVVTFPAQATTCHPKIDNLIPQYIVGYGSLIDEQSKKITDPSAEENFPVLITGYKRSWSAHGNLPGLNATFLAISKDKSSSFNGVIYKLSDPEKIEQYDKRERVYCRRELDAKQLNTYTMTLPSKKQIWIYVPKQNQYPTHDYPIVQSYVDTFIRGCIKIEDQFKIKNFAKDCIKSTYQWPTYWINDRIFPRRPFLYEPYAEKIDSLLKEQLSEQFKQIKFECSQ